MAEEVKVGRRRFFDSHRLSWLVVCGMRMFALSTYLDQKHG